MTPEKDQNRFFIFRLQFLFAKRFYIFKIWTIYHRSMFDSFIFLIYRISSFSSPKEEIQFWKSKYEAKVTELEDLELQFSGFYRLSNEN